MHASIAYSHVYIVTWFMSPRTSGWPSTSVGDLVDRNGSSWSIHNMSNKPAQLVGRTCRTWIRAARTDWYTHIRGGCMHRPRQFVVDAMLALNVGAHGAHGLPLNYLCPLLLHFSTRDDLIDSSWTRELLFKETQHHHCFRSRVHLKCILLFPFWLMERGRSPLEKKYWNSDDCLMLFPSCHVKESIPKL